MNSAALEGILEHLNELLEVFLRGDHPALRLLEEACNLGLLQLEGLFESVRVKHRDALAEVVRREARVH